MNRGYKLAPRMGLKLTIGIIVLTAALCSTLGVLSYVSSSTILMNSIIQAIMCRAEDNSELVKTEILTLKTNIEGVSNWVGASNSDWEELRPLLTEEATRLGVERIQLSTMRGVAISTNGGTMDISDRDYFRIALEGMTVITEPIISKMDGAMVIVCATPVKSRNGAVLGVLTATMDPGYLFKKIENKNVGKSGYGFVLNKEGVIIAHPNQNMVMSKENDISENEKKPELRALAALERRMANGETGYGFYTFYGIKKFLAFAPVHGTGWSIALTVPRDEVFSELDELRNKFIILTVIAIIAFIALLHTILKYISQKKMMETVLEDANENSRLLRESQEMDKLKTEFFANISHELRTPLNVINTTLQLLDFYVKKDAPLDKMNLITHIKSMKQNCRRLIRLVNNIIDTTCIDSGFFKIHPANHDIVRVVRDITASVGDYIKGKGLNLEFRTDIAKKIVTCDMDKIERVILNLLSNAVKFTPPGGNITVSVHDAEKNIIVSVKDTGIGIPEDKQEMIFNRFAQVDKSSTRNYEGSGIGLSLVKSLVEMHNGRVTVRSEYGNGSEFIVELPVSANSSADETQQDTLCTDKYTNQISVEFSDIKI